MLQRISIPIYLTELQITRLVLFNLPKQVSFLISKQRLNCSAMVLLRRLTFFHPQL